MTYDEILETMRARYRELAGFDADDASDIGIRLKVLAAQVYGLARRVEALAGEVFPQTSTGARLDMHAETRGLARKPAQRAQGSLRFTRETPAQSDVEIAAGVLCATRPDPQICFETLAAGVLRAGETSVEIPAQAAEAGALGNVAAGSVQVIVTGAPGISGVLNAGAFTGGADEENDEALRARLLLSYQQISNGANSAFYYDIAMQSDGVASANVLPRRRGRGTVDVVVACRGERASEEVVAELQARMQARKEINVDVVVREAEPLRVNVEAEIAVARDADADTVLAACGALAGEYVASLGVGASLLRAQLTGALLACEGVYNVRVISPAADVVPQGGQLVTADSVRMQRMAVG